MRHVSCHEEHESYRSTDIGLEDDEPGPEGIAGPGSVGAKRLLSQRCDMAAVNSPLLFSAPRVYPCQLG